MLGLMRFALILTLQAYNRDGEHMLQDDTVLSDTWPSICSMHNARVHEVIQVIECMVCVM